MIKNERWFSRLQSGTTRNAVWRITALMLVMILILSSSSTAIAQDPCGGWCICTYTDGIAWSDDMGCAYQIVSVWCYNIVDNTGFYWMTCFYQTCFTPDGGFYVVYACTLDI